MPFVFKGILHEIDRIGSDTGENTSKFVELTFIKKNVINVKM